MKNKKVVVTGGAGFVGSHLVDHLLECGANVTIVDNLSHGRYVNPDAEFFKADVSNVNTCRHFFRGSFAVFNLAATVAGVDWNKDNNAKMFQENVNVLIPPVIAASEVEVPNFVQFSSVCVYDPDNQDSPPEELGHSGFTHPANWGYGQAKRDGELAALHWSNLERAIVVRPTNMFGPRDHFRPMEQAHVIPALIQRIDEVTKGEPDLEVYGTPGTVREFMYVKDLARAVVHLVNHESASGVYNVGTGGETALTIKELIDTIAQVMGKKARPWWNQDRGGGDSVRRSNVDKIHGTGWKHEFGLKEGLEETVAWYNRYVKERYEI